MKIIDKIITKLSGDLFSIGGGLDISFADLITEHDKFITQEGIGKVYQVNQMKYEYDGDFISKLIYMISNINKSKPFKVKSYFEVSNTSISVNNQVFVSKMNKSIKDYLTYKTEYESLPKEIQESGIYQDNGVRRWSFTEKDILKRKHKYDSYVDVNNHIRNEQGKYFLISLFITVIYDTLKDYHTYTDQVLSIINQECSLAIRIDKNIATFLSNYSPSTLNTGEYNSSTMLFSEENLTHIIPFRTEGIICTKGLLLGKNVENNTPLFIDLFSSPDGSSTLINAKSGKGKSTLGYIDTLQWVSLCNTVIYIDLKGEEVTRCLSNALDNIKKIDFSDKSKSIINTMHLSEYIPEYDIKEAIKVTSEALSIFIDVNELTEGSLSDVIRVLRHAIKSYYNSVGVVEGIISTYHLSENMTYLNLLKYIGDQIDSGKEDRLMNLLGIITDRLSEAFVRYNMSDNNNVIDLYELFKFSVIVFDFNKNQDVMLTLIDQVRIYMVLMITKKIAKYNKSNGTFTNLKCEEGNRYHSYKQMCQGISDLASGSRSDNLSVTFITNDLNVLNMNELSGLRTNITNFIVGSCDNSSVQILDNVFKLPKLTERVNTINSQPAKYDKTFAVYFEMGGTICDALVKCALPLAVSDMFKTRDTFNK